MVCLILVSLFVWLRTSDSGEFAKQFSSHQKDNLVNVQLGQSGKIESNSAFLLLDFLLNLVLISISLWSWLKPASGNSRLVRRGRFMSQYVTIAVNNSFIYKLIWFVSNIHISCLCTKQHFYIHICIFIESNFWLLFDTSLESWPWVR